MEENEKVFINAVKVTPRDDRSGWQRMGLGYGFAPGGGVWRETTVADKNFMFSVNMSDFSFNQYIEIIKMFKKKGWTEMCCCCGGLYKRLDDNCGCIPNGNVSFLKCERYSTEDNVLMS